MRMMNIPPFRQKFESPDLKCLYKGRLSEPIVRFPEQALPLACYMAWPNDIDARDEEYRILKGWPAGSEEVPPGLVRSQHGWPRVADTFHFFCDLCDGQHQQRRGGPSIGKAITLVEANAKNRGTGAASLWLLWTRDKDVAHLVTSATLICADVRRRAGIDRFSPFQVVMLMPDLVLAVALEFERRGLSHIPHSRTEPALDHKTLWCIPQDINVAPIPPPRRKITSQDKVILNARRAGNRGRANKPGTTPVSDRSPGIFSSS
jgi:hypothetical protein